MSGDAESHPNEPRSFTRFVLPFAYALVPDPDSREPTPRYVELKDTDFSDERKLYLTGETRHVLFDRAVWLQLEGTEGKAVEFDFRWNIPDELGIPLNLHRKHPQLVLFEHEAAKEEGPLNVGFLLLDIEVKDKINPYNLDRLLHFNELFRYFAEPFSGHAKARKVAVALEDYVAEAKHAGEKFEGLTEKLYEARWESLLNFPLQIGRRTYQLDATIRRGEIHPDPAIHPDNRAFVWTAAVMEGGAGALQKPWGGDLRKPEEFGQWIHFLNVDPPSSLPSRTHEARTSFETDWARKRTYYRWAESGSWYGYCYHGGAAVIPPWRDPDPPLWQHWSGMYFDQILLLLYVRTAAFAFSSGLSAISAEARRRGYKSREWLSDEFAQLRWQFALFTNLYRFPLLSNQQQGLEMYVLARKRMDADELFEEVDEEIRNCDEYLASYTQTRQTRASTRLNMIAIVGLILGLALALVQADLRLPWIQGASSNAVRWKTFFVGLALAGGVGACLGLIWRFTANVWRRVRKTRPVSKSKKEANR